ncbi:MAG: Uma2 family endonuclease [Candidatus Kapaibacteriota bacterium]
MYITRIGRERLVETPSRPIGEPGQLVYPDSDGEPVAQNTEQFDWIQKLNGELESLFRDRPDVFVASDLFWYPVEGDPKIRFAPDTLVVFGRPKGYRGSYKQWLEKNIAPQVIFEVLSPSNDEKEMEGKREWYERYGADEYYELDPIEFTLRAWIRLEGRFQEVSVMNQWISPLLGIRFEYEPEKSINIYRPDGRPFFTFVEIERMREEAIAMRDEALEREKTAVNFANEALEREKKAVNREKEVLERLNKEQTLNERLAAKLRELGIDPSAV